MIKITNTNPAIFREVCPNPEFPNVTKTYAKTEFIADTASDIATMNDAANGYLNYPAGSMVICLGNGKIYMLDGTNHEYLEFKSGGSSRSKADLSRSVENCAVTVTVSGTEVTDGINALTVGASATITATASEGYTMSTLTVNGETHTSGQAITVSGDVVIEAVATETPTPSHLFDEDMTFTLSEGYITSEVDATFPKMSDINTTDDYTITISALSLTHTGKFTLNDVVYTLGGAEQGVLFGIHYDAENPSNNGYSVSAMSSDAGTYEVILDKVE